MRATFSVRSISAAVSVIVILGVLAIDAEDALMDAHALASTPTTHAILFDCSGLDRLHSSGIGLLITLLVRMRRQRQRLVIFGLSEHDERVLDLTRLNEVVAVCATEAEALAMAADA